MRAAVGPDTQEAVFQSSKDAINTLLNSSKKQITITLPGWYKTKAKEGIE